MEERRSREKIINLEVYTDGSLKKMGTTMTFGGWAFIALRDNQVVYKAAEGVYDTTNQRMELEAIRRALQYVSAIRRKNEKVVIFSDSAYAINCYTQGWYLNWQSHGWLNASKKEVANQDLWIDIIPYFDNFWYTFKKVQGHANVYWNEMCDKMAQHEAEKLKIEWRGENGK